MKTQTVNKLLEQVEDLKHQYEKQFGKPIPDKIIGWWDPLSIVNYPEELEKGVVQMREDISKAIATNTPIEEIPADKWDNIIF